MAARKRKAAPPKQTAKIQAEPEVDQEVEPAAPAEAEPEPAAPVEAEAEAAPSEEADAEFPASEPEHAEREPSSGREPDDADAAPDSESERVTLAPRSRVKDADAEELNGSSEPDSPPDFNEELIGEGPSDVDESRVDDTGAYLKGLLEALLFVSDRPLEIKDLARAAKIDKKRVEELIEEIRHDFQHRGVRLDEVGDGYAFRSNPAYSEYVRGYLSLKPVRLSRAQLETLSIVAYRQPITRPEVDDIRGVDAGPVLKGLLERDLIRIIGKKDEPGRPMLYGTTQTFLQVFSLKSPRDLPTLREFTELNDESRRTFAEELGEEAPEGPISFEEAMAADASTDAAGTAESTEAGDATTDATAERAESEDPDAASEPAEQDEAEDGDQSDDDESDDDDDDESDDDDDDESDDDDDDDDEASDDDDESDDDDDESDDDDDESDDDESDDDDDDESDDDEDDESDDDDDDDDDDESDDEDEPAEKK